MEDINIIKNINFNLNTNSEVLFFFNGTTTGVKYNRTDFNRLRALEETSRTVFRIIGKEFYLRRLEEIENTIYEKSKKYGGNITKDLIGELEENETTFFSLYILHLLIIGVIENDEENGFMDINNLQNFFNINNLQKKVSRKKINIPKPKAPTISSNLGVGRFISHETQVQGSRGIETLTKEELRTLGTRLGLQGLTKLNRQQLEDKIKRERRNDVRVQNFIDDLLT